jgi:phage terminase small subunit
MSNRTDKQERFCLEYLVDLNATAAAKRAGYSEDTAYSIGHELLKKPEILARVQEMKAERSKRVQVDADFIVEGFKEVALRCMQQKPVMKWDHRQKEFVQEQDDQGRDVWQFDSHGANKAFEMLGKHIGFFEKDNEQKSPISEVTLNIVKGNSAKP